MLSFFKKTFGLFSSEEDEDNENDEKNLEAHEGLGHHLKNESEKIEDDQQNFDADEEDEEDDNEEEYDEIKDETSQNDDVIDQELEIEKRKNVWYEWSNERGPTANQVYVFFG